MIKYKHMKQAIVWSKNHDILGKNDRAYVINQVLMFGSLPEIQALIKKYGKHEVREVFLHQPLKIYSRPAVNFIQKIILGIKDEINYDRYVKSLY